MKIKLILDFHAQICQIAQDFDTKDISIVNELTDLINMFEVDYENLIEHNSN